MRHIHIIIMFFFSCSPIPHNCMNAQHRSHTSSCYEETGSHFIPGTDRRAVTINTVETPDFNSNMQMLTLNSHLKTLPTAQIKISQWKETTKTSVMHKLYLL